MPFALRLAGLFRAGFLALLLATLSPAHADNRESGGDLPLSRHTLVLPANLPHLAWVLKGQTAAIGLDETQRNALAALAFEARDTLQPLLQEARNVERAIAAATLDGKEIGQLADELDRLQQLKRQATDAQINLNGRIRAALTPEQYAHLLRLAQTMPDAGPGVVPGKAGAPPGGSTGAARLFAYFPPPPAAFDELHRQAAARCRGETEPGAIHRPDRPPAAAQASGRRNPYPMHRAGQTKPAG